MDPLSESLSIDALVASPSSPASPTSSSPSPSPSPVERPKLKGRQRLFENLQRISSSPSLSRRARSASTNTTNGYGNPGKAAMSTVSLSSSPGSPVFIGGHSYGSSVSSDLSVGYSTAPTSAVSTPCPGSPDTIGLARMCLTDLGTSVRGDYFSQPLTRPRERERRHNFNFWADLPPEICMQILQYLKPKEIVRCSAVSRSWHRMCYDGQLWGTLDTSDFYRDIPADALVSIITSAGPFVRDLNLRGCVQLRERWGSNQLVEACRNLQMFSIEGCRIDRTSIHGFLSHNNRLAHLNLAGLAGATNSAMKIVAANCPKLEYLNISWCNNIDTRGIRKVVEGCPNLRDLRAGEVRGWDDITFMSDLFKRNTLERLVLNHCDSLNDESLSALIVGVDSEIDVLTDRPMVPPRKLKHLDLMRCRGVTDRGFRVLAHHLPHLEGLQLSKCAALTDDSLEQILPTMPMLTHLDMEELDQLTNDTLRTLAASPCSDRLQHLSISYCENLGDAGMLPVLKSCKKLATLDMDNTRISDLVLTEAAALVRARNHIYHSNSASRTKERPQVSLRLVAYDCSNVTWCGVREVLTRNAEIIKSTSKDQSSGFPAEIIQLRCFYNWQPTVDEHTKRVLRGDFSAASRLERKWTEWMMATEEAAVGGTGHRRRRRRQREAYQLHNEEAVDAPGTAARGSRRRARTTSACVVM